jgi:purine-binding chemotaxis protein CheW
MTEAAEPAQTRSASGPTDVASCIVFSASGRRFAVPVEVVEGVTEAPPLTRVPHADAALLGAASLGGRIVPVLDFVGLIEGQPAAAADGAGEVLRLRTAAGSAGFRVDRVEGLARIDPAGNPGGFEMIDPDALLARRFARPALASLARRPLGDAADLVPAVPGGAASSSFIVVEAAGETIRLRREQAIELVEDVPWTPIPRAPPALLGVALLHGSATPVLSLAALLGLRSEAPQVFVRTELDGRQLLIGVDRILGLRVQRQASSRRWAALSRDDLDTESAPLDLAAAIPEGLRGVIFRFTAPAAGTEPHHTAALKDVAEYLVFSADGQDWAVAIGSVERIVDARPVLRLPRLPADENRPRFAGAIERRGELIPVVVVRPGPGTGEEPQRGAPHAFVILRSATGPTAVAADQIKEVVRLGPGEIFGRLDAGYGPVDAIAKQAGCDVLRIVAVERMSAVE